MSGMIGLDTNVLVRYIMQDDPRQSKLATDLLESLSAESPGFVAVIAVVELVWVLSSAYSLSRAQIVDALEALLRTREITVDQAETVWMAVRIFRDTNVDFADCLIARVSSAAGCSSIVTFDQLAARSAGMTLLL